MSTLVYANISKTRTEDSQRGEEHVGRMVEAVAGLVPAEILAAHAIIVAFATSTMEGADGVITTTITDSDALRWSFWALLIVSFLVQWIGTGKLKPGWRQFSKGVIPAGAFAAWTMLQKTTAFDAAFPDLGEVARMAAASIGAVLLIALARALAVPDAKKKDSNAASRQPPGTAQ